MKCALRLSLLSHPHAALGILGAALCLALAGCAAPTRTPAQIVQAAEHRFWSGRMGLQVHDSHASEQSFSASFQLQGQAEAGQLDIFNPLGSQIAQLTWTPGGAVLRQGAHLTTSESLHTLVQQSLGTALPIAAMFGWLQGTPTAAAGWEVDLSRHADGRITAQRTHPSPTATLRLVLEQP